jgi:hypothetical protein
LSFKEKTKRREIMKAIFNISVLAALLVSSCTTGRYNMSSEYDDLYYSKSDKPAVSQKVAPNDFVNDQNADKYYDNIYSGDTLVADEYNDAVDFSGSMFYNKDQSPFEYADDYSYSNRLSRFYGNYFYPYWRDPFYYNYPYYGGFYDPYYYDPYFYGGLYFSFGFGFGGYYPYYGYGYYPGYGYGGYYPPYYGGYPPYYGDEYVTAGMGRRETYSTLTSNYSNIAPSRKSGYGGGSGSVSDQRRQSYSSTQSGQVESRRGAGSVQGTNRQGVSSEMRNAEYYQRRAGSVNSNSQATRPEYNSQNRSYTPSYNNPRMSERPSYNNSRVSEGSNRSENAVSGRPAGNSGSYYRSGSAAGAGSGRMYNQGGGSGRTGSSASEGNSMIRYPSSNNYSVPSSSRSEGSYNSGSSNSGNSGSYRSSGSSGGYSGGSSSSGSSGGGGGGYGGRSSGGGSGTRR